MREQRQRAGATSAVWALPEAIRLKTAWKPAETTKTSSLSNTRAPTLEAVYA
jgi:hypothetical protein